MKVHELITLLSKCDSEATVKFDDTYIGIDRSDITTVYEARCLGDGSPFVILTNEEDAEE